MQKNKRIKLTEIILLSTVVLMVVSSPYWFAPNKFSSWEWFVRPMISIVPTLIVFFINRFLLVPRLLLRGKRTNYLLTIGLLLICTAACVYMFEDKRLYKSYQLPKQHRSGEGALPSVGGEKKLPPPGSHRRLPPPEGERRMPPPHGHRPPPPGHKQSSADEKKPALYRIPKRRKPAMPPFMNFFIMTVLLVGFDTGIRVAFRMAKLETENISAQLAFLRNQVSPHFFMNTLNNIHSLIDINTEEAKEAIIQLAKLMRHLLYNSEGESIKLSKELEFVKNYIDLMKLRYYENVEINLTLPSKLPDKSIPPLLFISYIDNAFKHGISYTQHSFIDISFQIEAGYLYFETKNSNPKLTKKTKTSGIGLENSRKRLDLLFGKNYTLDIDDNKTYFRIRLKIPL